MKRMIRRRLLVVIFATMLLSLFLNCFLQIYSARNDMYRNSKDKFRQIEQILTGNQKDIEEAKKNLEEDCFIRARAAAYIIQKNPEVIGDLSEIQKIARLLQVDELHLFDTEGNLFAGSQPKYYGLNFSSGEQMSFFLPMLQDRSLQMCQDITPNTAEQKMMQYAAVWREDGVGIVQIGLEPVRVLEVMKKNELSYIFSMVTAEAGTVIYAIDPVSYQILGSTDGRQIGKNVSETGLAAEQLNVTGRGFTGNVNGKNSYCVFTTADSCILGIVRANDFLYQDVYRSTKMVAVYLAVISIIMFICISSYIDKYIVDGIFAINDKLVKITNGNLDTRVEVESTPEFCELSGQINSMVRSLLDTTNKLSEILDIAKVPIGVYEYNQDMKRVMATSRVSDILMISGDEADLLYSDYSLFEKRMEEIWNHPLNQESGVYEVPGERQRFVRIELFNRHHSVLGMITDVTEDILEKQRIERERDIDLLTGLYSRRAFYNNMDTVINQPGQIGCAVMIMTDGDNLKTVNDKYGHEYGDKYLRAIAGILGSCRAENKIAARLGGDEMVLFVYSGTVERDLAGYVDEILETMEKTALKIDENTVVPVSFSAGCAYFPEDSTDYHKLLKIADERMYQVKKSRKGR